MGMDSIFLGGTGAQGPQGAAGTGSQGPQGAQGIAGGGTLVAGDYCPPAFQYSSATNLYIIAGRYFAVGARAMQQYWDLDNDTYWDISSALDVNVVTNAYSAGSQSGRVGGLVGDSWYSVWLVGNDANSVIITPMMRPATIDYNSTNPGKTTVSGMWGHNTWADAATGYLTADDQWNGYQLYSTDSPPDACLNSGGPIRMYGHAAIEDCTNASPDVLILDGDQTDWLKQNLWYHVAPPAATDFVYLGCIRVNSSNEIAAFHRVGWIYRWKYAGAFNIPTHASAFNGNTVLFSKMPPQASRAWCATNLRLTGSGVSMQVGGLISQGTYRFWGSGIQDGDNLQALVMYNPEGVYATGCTIPFEFQSYYPSQISAVTAYHSSGTIYVISGGGSATQLYVIGFEE